MAVAEEEGPAGGDSVEAGAGTAMGASWFVTFPSIADPRSFASLSNDSGLFVMFTYPRIIILGESLTQLIVYLRRKKKKKTSIRFLSSESNPILNPRTNTPF